MLCHFQRAERLFALMVCALVLTGRAEAQKKRVEPVFIPGTVVSMEKPEKSRTYTLKIKSTADESEHEFPILPRTPLSITAPGDGGFLRPNLMVSSELLQSNQQLFGKEFTVYTKGGPAPFVRPGNSNEVFEACGKILAIEGEVMSVNFGAKGTQQVHLEAGYKVNVIVTDPELVQPGATVEVDAIPLRGGKAYNPTRITVKLEAALKSDDFFAKPEEKKGTRGKSKTKETVPEVNDPFGLLKKPNGAKEAEKPKSEKPE